MNTYVENLVNRASRIVKNWWLFLLAGILCAVAGVLFFVYPLESYMTLSYILGVLMLAVGVSEIISSITNRSLFMRRGYMIVGGILDIILGIFMCVYPGVTALMLPLMLGLWTLYHSIMIISFGSDLNAFRVSGSGWMIAGGLLLAILSVVVLIKPFGIGVAAVVILCGVGLVTLGAMLTGMAFRLRNIHRQFSVDEQ